MHCQAWRVEGFMKAFLEDPPRPLVLRCKTGDFDSYLSEFAYLPSVGEYANDAWQLFCREHIYASAGIRTRSNGAIQCLTEDRLLLRYV